MNKEIPIDATWTDVASDGAECTAIVPQNRDELAEQVYRALPVHKQSQAAWGQIQRASTAELQAVYEAHVVVNHDNRTYDNRVANYYEEHHHHHAAPPSESPGRVEFIPMPYPVVEYRDVPQQQPAVNFYNTVETSSHGGNAHAHAQAETDDSWGGGRGVFSAIFLALAIVALVGAIAGE